MITNPGRSSRVRALAAGLALAALVAASAEAAPALVLFITIDQLRGDVPRRMYDALAPNGGLRHLMDNGVHYTNAHFRHSTTFTSVGHATLHTGGHAPEHGICGNQWFDRRTGRPVYSVEDPRHRVLGRDPASHEPHEGTSPALLASSTIGDELVTATGGASRVFSVSIKDRGAIIPGGHLGRAYWYDGERGRFVTSTYYADAEPAWVAAWNDAGPAERYRGTTWDLLRPRETYRAAGDDDRPFETSYGSLGRVFPHPIEDVEGAPFTKTIAYTPMGDELMLSFVEALVARERVGQLDETDLLALSFSATDYIGHAFGPYSLEAEDNVLRLDRTLGRLLRVIDEAVGLNRTLVVLSSDHGVDAAPEHRHALACRTTARRDARLERAPGGRMMLTGLGAACCAAGRHVPDRFIAQANAALSARFGVEDDLVAAFWNPGLYLDRDVVAEAGLDAAEVEAELASLMRTVPGIALAVTRSDLMAGRVADTAMLGKVRRSFHPQRSGDVLVVQDPFWFLYHRPTAYAAMHGSPYSYDTHVPIIVAGPGLAPATIDRLVAPQDIAPTLAAWLDLVPPSGCTGTPLAEVLAMKRRAPDTAEPTRE